MLIGNAERDATAFRGWFVGDFVPADEETQLLSAWLPLEEAVRKVFAGELHNGVAALGIMAGYAARSEGFDRLRPADAPEEQ